MANVQDKSATRQKVNKFYERNKNAHITCQRCGRTMNGAEYYTTKEGEYYPVCKVCLTSGIDSKKPKTFLDILKTFDVPFIKEMWLETCKKQYVKNPERYSSASVFGTYLRTMKMGKYRNYGYDDAGEATKFYLDRQTRYRKSDESILGDVGNTQPPQTPPPVTIDSSLGVDSSGLNQEPSEDVWEVPTEVPQESVQEPNDEDELDFASMISDVRKENAKQDFLSGGFAGGSLDDRKMQRESEIAAKLTPDDIMRLSIKWGDDYRPTEWIRMEETYRKYANEFEMNVDREEVLKKMCKTSLKMDQALDDGNIADYTKLQSAFDALRKSGKFTEAQNKDKEDKYLDSVGELVAAVEREGGIIPKFNYKYETTQDKIDLTLRDCQSYLYNLVRNEMGLGNLIETYIQKLDQQAAQTITTSLGDGLVTSRSEEEEADRAADNWMLNLQSSIEKDADRIFSQLDEE